MPTGVSTDGTCGGAKGLKCQGSTFGNCCSSGGYCGSTTAHCAQGWYVVAYFCFCSEIFKVTNILVVKNHFRVLVLHPTYPLTMVSVAQRKVATLALAVHSTASAVLQVASAAPPTPTARLDGMYLRILQR